jgi:hypothetical protein
LDSKETSPNNLLKYKILAYINVISLYNKNHLYQKGIL